MISFTVELWDRLGRAGVERKEYHSTNDPERKEEMELKLLEWSDRELAGRGFAPWTKFDHPQLGEVELGGWDPKFVLQNPPPKFLEQECHKNTMFNLRHAASLPRTVVEKLTIQSTEAKTYTITAVVGNHGYLPTNTTNKAKEAAAVKPDRARLKLPKNVELLSGELEEEIGFLDGYMNGQEAAWGTPDPAESSARVKWLVRGEPGDEVTVCVVSERGGTHCETAVLPE
jgi:murein tripeptide amidase MpaA